MNALSKYLTAAILATSLSSAWACSSCGCTLSSDWPSQGIRAESGLSVDLRHDYFNQDQLRSGARRIDRAGISFPAEQEIQRDTVNHVSTLSLDYGFSADWSAALQLPYVVRSHGTVSEGDTEVSNSRSSGLGDVRLLFRYAGISAQRDWGVQLGLKLPTGRTDVEFAGGPQAGEPLDRGLQPGTGTTDLLMGIYHFGTAIQNLDYFAQAMLQLPLNSKNDFRPGASLGASVGIRYAAAGPVTPQLQINLRSERRESGADADVENSGSTLVYASPGATISISDQAKAYAFVQVPIYQRVNGLQILPRRSISVGLRYSY